MTGDLPVTGRRRPARPGLGTGGGPTVTGAGRTRGRPEVTGQRRTVEAQTLRHTDRYSARFGWFIVVMDAGQETGQPTQNRGTRLQKYDTFRSTGRSGRHECGLPSPGDRVRRGSAAWLRRLATVPSSPHALHRPAHRAAAAKFTSVRLCRLGWENAAGRLASKRLDY